MGKRCVNLLHNYFLQIPFILQTRILLMRLTTLPTLIFTSYMLLFIFWIVFFFALVFPAVLPLLASSSPTPFQSYTNATSFACCTELFTLGTVSFQWVLGYFILYFSFQYCIMTTSPSYYNIKFLVIKFLSFNLMNPTDDEVCNLTKKYKQYS